MPATTPVGTARWLGVRPGPPAPSAAATSPATSSSEATPASGTKWTIRWSGLAAHHLGETGLAEAAGTDDRGDPDRAQQVRHRGDVVVPAEQRVGLVRHPVADDRRGALQQLLVDGLEGGAGVGAELVTERAAVGLVAVQRRRRTHRRRLAAQQLGQHLLVPRTLAGQPGQLVGRLGVATQPRQRQRPGPRQRPVGRRPFRAQRGHRVVQAGVAALGPLPQREPRLGVRERRRVVAGLGASGARRRRCAGRPRCRPGPRSGRGGSRSGCWR